jgi:hypothetical protein
VAVTTGHAEVKPAARWHVLLRPRWLAWHALVLLATAGMIYLGLWQLHRAESGNELSWAYTFEWPLFAAFGGYFWIKSLRDELQPGGSGGSGGSGGPSGGAAAHAPAAGQAVEIDIARATPDDGEAYVARLKAEVQRHGRWHGWR